MGALGAREQEGTGTQSSRGSRGTQMGFGGVRWIPRMREPRAGQGWTWEAGLAERLCVFTTVLEQAGERHSVM